MQEPFRPRRSALYMPGSNPRALEKARTLAADVLILDLEDAVAPDAKAAAREQVAGAVRAKGFGQREVVVRVNGEGTAWHEDDLRAVAAAGPDAVLVPKVEEPAALARCAGRLAGSGAAPSLRLWAMMETPRAILNGREIAAFADPAAKLAVLVMGTNDLAKETRARLVPGRAPMLPWLMTCLAAARANGLDILDGVYNDFRDQTGFRAECEQGRALGMDGKTLIHPDQVAPANEIFAPTAAEIADADRIAAAFALPENAGKGVITLAGRMVERLHAEMAQRTLALARAIAARER